MAAREADAPSRSPYLYNKIVICVTEDWFALSHFKPLMRRLLLLSRDVVVIARSSGRLAEIEELGVRTIAFEYHRSSMNPAREAATARSLAAILRAEKPDVIHLIAMKAIVLGILALGLAPRPRIVLHITGLGFLAISDSMRATFARAIALKLLGRTVRRTSTWLLVENSEDLAFLKGAGADPGTRFTMLGGAGIDPDEFVVQPEPNNAVPIAAFVGRIIWPKGVDILMEAARLLSERKTPIIIELYGPTEDNNREAITHRQLESWSDGRKTHYMGITRDIVAVWRHADIFVLPARSREGMPRALLEAAASGRPLVVTDVPGCREFVSNGVEGLIVPPNDPVALADALERLARNPALRAQFGAAARTKIMSGYTESKVEADVEAAYRNLGRLG